MDTTTNVLKCGDLLHSFPKVSEDMHIIIVYLYSNLGSNHSLKNWTQKYM